MRKTFKKTNFKSNNGITLIALVITIIVLLILAGVAISMLAGENGIINKANIAKTDNEAATVEEQVKLAVMAALAAGNGEIKGTDAFTALNDALDEAGYEGDDIQDGDLPATITIDGNDYVIETNGTTREPSEIEKLKGGEAVDTKTTLKDGEGKQVVIPELFSVAEDSATLVKDGIVVIAPDESEFVWVPVEDINSMVMCQSHTGTSDCSIVKGDDGELKCENHADTLICGKLYATSTEENFDNTLTTQTYSITSGLSEPVVLTSTTHGDYVTGSTGSGIGLLKSHVGLTGTDEEIKEQWQTQLQDEYEEMAKCVYENKGFYVGRYETSLDSTTKEAQSKANQPSATVANASPGTWFALYKKEKDYSKKEYEAGKTLENLVGSTMIWGSQYDQMMLWMQANGYNIKSTDSNELKGAIKILGSTSTGVEEDKDILNNVYDLLGCFREYTLEACNTDQRVSRGGYWSGSNSPSSRSDDFASNPSGPYSSRVSLYVK